MLQSQKFLPNEEKRRNEVRHARCCEILLFTFHLWCRTRRRVLQPCRRASGPVERARRRHASWRSWPGFCLCNYFSNTCSEIPQNWKREISQTDGESNSAARTMRCLQIKNSPMCLSICRELLLDLLPLRSEKQSDSTRTSWQTTASKLNGALKSKEKGPKRSALIFHTKSALGNELLHAWDTLDSTPTMTVNPATVYWC